MSRISDAWIQKAIFTFEKKKVIPTLGQLLEEVLRGSIPELAMPLVCINSHRDKEDLGHREQVQASDPPQETNKKQL
jgi:hypothetical protein